LASHNKGSSSSCNGRLLGCNWYDW